MWIYNLFYRWGAPKIYGFMRGFQVVWGLVTKEVERRPSINCVHRDVQGAAIGNSFPVVPLDRLKSFLKGRLAEIPACGTGMCAFHVDFSAQDQSRRPPLCERALSGDARENPVLNPDRKMKKPAPDHETPLDRLEQVGNKRIRTKNERTPAEGPRSCLHLPSTCSCMAALAAVLTLADSAAKAARTYAMLMRERALMDAGFTWQVDPREVRLGAAARHAGAVILPRRSPRCGRCLLLRATSLDPAVFWQGRKASARDSVMQNSPPASTTVRATARQRRARRRRSATGG